jgi:hypothetical protein
MLLAMCHLSLSLLTLLTFSCLVFIALAINLNTGAYHACELDKTTSQCHLRKKPLVSFSQRSFTQCSTPSPVSKDAALDHNTSDDIDDNILTHCMPQTANPGFIETHTVAAANTDASMRGPEGPSEQQGAQAEALVANTTAIDFQSSKQAPPPSQVNQDLEQQKRL